MTNRRSYRKLLAMPAYGLYKGDKLVATIRAENAYQARAIFRQHDLSGDRVP